MPTFLVTNVVKRFPGKHGWYFVALDKKRSEALRPALNDAWPALLKAELTLNETTWRSSIMPIKNGPLFIALPAKVRKAEQISEGQRVRITVSLLEC